MEVAGSTGDAGRKKRQKTVEWLDDVRTCSVVWDSHRLASSESDSDAGWRGGVIPGVMLPIQEQLWRLFGDRLQLGRGGGGPKA